jgi:type I restriction enzyme S subunit
MSAMPSKLGDYITHVRSVAPQAVFGDSNFTYVDISSVDRASRAILNPQVISTSAAPSRARQELAQGDVIVSTVRPNLNTVAIVTDEHADAIASTGFCVLRANTDRLDPRYLYHWVSSAATVARLVSSATGATYPAVSDKTIKSLEVSFPPISEQQRIATILDKVDSLRFKRQEVVSLTDKFLIAAYVEMLGDPATNPFGWRSVEFDRLVDSTKLGLVRSAEEFGWEFPVPYLRMDAITDDGKILKNKIQGTNATGEEVESFGLQSGDFLFNTRNSRELVGKTAVWFGPDGVIFNNNIMRVRFTDEIAPEVVAMQFLMPLVKRELESRKSGTTSVFAVYYKDLRTLPIQVPDKGRQNAFIELVAQVRKYRHKVETMLREAEKLSRAFGNQFFA